MTQLISPRGIESHQLEGQLNQHLDQQVTLTGMVLRIRTTGWGAFVVLSLPRHVIQCVAANEIGVDLSDLRVGDFIRVSGTVTKAKIKDLTVCPRDVEIQVKELSVLQRCSDPYPVDISKKELDVHLDRRLDFRPITLRHPRERAIFRIAEGVCRGFRDQLMRNGFTEIHTPKLVFAGAEGGAGIFEVTYFDRKAFLAQSPQFYKQMGVGIFGRVLEIGPVFRAEKHQTSRHLNEYTSLDYEMGPIQSYADVMALELEVLNAILDLLRAEYLPELEILDAQLPPHIETAPALDIQEAHNIASDLLGQDFRSEPDLDPAEERALCQWSQEQHNSELIFITGFPRSKRPFYTMDDPQDPTRTLSFDLLFRGLEITTGGQRIHGYVEQQEKLRSFGLDPAEFESFLMMHRYGMPPHGGLGLGLERLVSRLLGMDNVREASMFPRDIRRLTP